MREIAVLRAIGFGAPAIAALIVSEAAALALAGGGLGALACLALLEFGALGLGAEGVYIEFTPSVATALGAVGAAVLTAVAAAAAPAIATTRRTIVEALRA